MPRPQFSQLPAPLTAMCLAAALAGPCASEALAAPDAVINTIATSGQAPFTVHAHGLNSYLDVGTELTARYEWNFGDPSGAYNTLVGWNAAHTYNQPGTYTLTLTVTNPDGAASTEQRTITVSPANRTTIYVSPNGNDGNSGLSPAAAIKTFAKAATMLASNRAILFERNGVFSVSASMNIGQQNVLIGAYGSGAIPKLNWVVNDQYNKIINMWDSASQVIIENLRFDSNFAPDNLIVRATHPHGHNITVRNCHFGNISYAMNTDGGGVYGLLSQSNTTGVIGAYYCWANGADHTHLGNDVDGSASEHNIRFGNCSRTLIAHNDLTNNTKSTIWCMLGDHAYIGCNVLRQGRFIAGPNFATSTPAERFRYVVFERNRIENQGVILYAGAEDMIFRNNVIQYDGGEAFSIWGYYATWNRTCKNISLQNNTAFNNSAQSGRFLRLGNDAQNIVVCNNLYCAPSLNSSAGAANVKSDDTDLNTHAFHHNLWATPDYGSYPHSLSTGGQTASQWDSHGQTWNEQYRSFNGSDLNALFAPTFNCSNGPHLDGVFTDFHGNARPAGWWTLGAVESETGPITPPPPPPPPPPSKRPEDLNHDGAVNVHDLMLVIDAWGMCPLDFCPADLDANGVVNVQDLLRVVAAW